MKKQKILIAALFAGACIAGSVWASAAQPAQIGPPHERPALNAGRPAEITPEGSARRKADALRDELNLNGKQYKKVYKLYLKQANKEISTSRPQQGESAGGMSGGGRMGRGGMQGGPPGGMGMGGGGGQPSMGGMPAGGMGGGMPGGDAPAQAGRMQNGPDKDAVAPFMEDDKDVAARDKKMKKILTAEQYGKWREWELNDRRRSARKKMQMDMGDPSGAAGREFPQRNPERTDN